MRLERGAGGGGRVMARQPPSLSLSPPPFSLSSFLTCASATPAWGATGFRAAPAAAQAAALGLRVEKRERERRERSA